MEKLRILQREINSYEECVDAGYEILYPDCVGCKPYCVTPDGKTFSDNNIDKYIVKYEDEYIKYNITQTKPTPCHTINVDVNILNKEILINLDIISPDKPCIQVIDEQEINGEIFIENPELVKIKVDGVLVYTTNF